MLSEAHARPAPGAPAGPPMPHAHGARAGRFRRGKHTTRHALGCIGRRGGRRGACLAVLTALASTSGGVGASASGVVRLGARRVVLALWQHTGRVRVRCLASRRMRGCRAEKERAQAGALGAGLSVADWARGAGLKRTFLARRGLPLSAQSSTPALESRKGPLLYSKYSCTARPKASSLLFSCVLTRLTVSTGKCSTPAMSTLSMLPPRLGPFGSSLALNPWGRPQESSAEAERTQAANAEDRSGERAVRGGSLSDAPDGPMGGAGGTGNGAGPKVALGFKVEIQPFTDDRRLKCRPLRRRAPAWPPAPTRRS